MSRLNPGGSRTKEGRIFGAKTIAKACKANLKNRDHSAIAETSLGGMRHGEGRAAERRRKQMERRLAKGGDPL